MAENLLRNAIELVKSGDRQNGKKALVEFLAQDPKNETGWLWLATASETNYEKRVYLQKALDINPGNLYAQKALINIEEDQPSIHEIASTTSSNLDSTNKMKDGSIEFIAANCPNCGGELRIPDNRDMVKCMYCGIDVFIHDPSKIKVEFSGDVEKFVKLGKSAEEGSNYPEALKYYSLALEEDPKNSMALLGKGFSVGMLGTRQNLRVQEVHALLHQALYGHLKEHEPTSNADPKIVKLCADIYWKIASHYSGLLIDFQDAKAGHEIIHLEMNLYSERASLIKSYNLYYNVDSENAMYISLIKVALTSANVRVASVPGNTVELRKKFISRIEQSCAYWKWIIKEENIDQARKMMDQFVADGKKNDCFIATATMGDSDHPYVLFLRSFRDDYMMTSSWGKKIISGYYRYSPPLANIIKESESLRKASLLLIIQPVVFVISLMTGREVRTDFHHNVAK